MNIIVFEDARVADLDPVTTARPVFAVSCASFRLVDLLRRIHGNLIATVRPHLTELVAHDYPDFQSAVQKDLPWTVCLNGRIAPTVSNLRLIELLTEMPQSMVVIENDVLIAAKLDTRQFQLAEVLQGSQFDSQALMSAELARRDSLSGQSFELIDQLHDLVRINSSSFVANLNFRLDHGEFYEIADGVFSRQRMPLDPRVVAETHEGPIIIEEDCRIGPGSFLKGPLYLGKNCKIAEHAAIKECVSVGTSCKLGGEIEETVIESYTNKQHHGFLGHSYLGSWINLGAGTCNSNLKNTYGLVNMVRGQKKISTEMQFVGCFIGDYAKTAINTSIFTGKTIGVCSMVYGFAAENVPAFSNYARTLGQITEVDPQVMIKTQQRMFGRRKVQQRPCDSRLIEDMFVLTSAERHNLDRAPLVF